MRPRSWRDWFGLPSVRIALATFIVLCIIGLSFFAYEYVKYQRIIDARMSGQIFETSAQIYAAPKTVEVGDKATPAELAAQLRRAGYTESGAKPESRLGTFNASASSIEIQPGPESYHAPDGAVVRISGGKVDTITGMGSTQGKALAAYELEPQLITGLFNQERSTRQLVKYSDIPKVMVDAVVAIEDRRFFQHNGVNYFRILAAAWADFRSGRRSQGGSTITMQIPRQSGFFLTQEKHYKRKLIEMLIAVELEQRFSKQQIFELYANSVNMGQRGSFSIDGFGEAARSYFNKDLKDVNLPEAALLAAIIQRPSYLSPYRHPDRALDRRNMVLDDMVETGAITKDQAEKAKATPLKLAPPNVEASDAPYFVDLVRDTLQQRYAERDLNQNQDRIYTSLDPDLQKAAADAIEVGIKGVDEQVAKLHTHREKVGKGKEAKVETKVTPYQPPQVALVALNAQTGEVLALVGGRNYGQSQLNHAVAKRPTGSIFKPFVYAAAVNTAVDGAQPVFTSVSTIDDSPTTFTYGDQIYEPRNYKEEYHGTVTARYALALSLNNATVKLAEEVGYDHVADLARAAGITSVKATPAMALGAYEATPLEMAGAYTVFADQGNKIAPVFIKSLRDAKGDVVEEFNAQTKPVLDPRVAYVMTNMMQGVMDNGYGYAVRQKGFMAPAAGKTGTSHDAWFAGYTSNIICVVWVGNDDYTDIHLSGAIAAAPIWAEFMKRAQELPQYSDMKPFPPPDGVVMVTIDKVTNRVATPACSTDTFTAAFIAGTEPHDTCEQSGGFFQKLGALVGMTPKPLPPPTTNGPTSTAPATGTNGQPATAQGQQQQDKKKGFFGKIFGVFKGDDKDKQQPAQPVNRPPQ